MGHCQYCDGPIDEYSDAEYIVCCDARQKIYELETENKYMKFALKEWANAETPEAAFFAEQNLMTLALTLNKEE